MLIYIYFVIYLTDIYLIWCRWHIYEKTFFVCIFVLLLPQCLSLMFIITFHCQQTKRKRTNGSDFESRMLLSAWQFDKLITQLLSPFIRVIISESGLPNPYKQYILGLTPPPAFDHTSISFLGSSLLFTWLPVFSP